MSEVISMSEIEFQIAIRVLQNLVPIGIILTGFLTSAFFHLHDNNKLYHS